MIDPLYLILLAWIAFPFVVLAIAIKWGQWSNRRWREKWDKQHPIHNIEEFRRDF